ncbi:polysaccharide lyase family 7 protein [Saccharothrix variisporea]|uniref:Glycosyl hydrolase family 16 n=1 Tax=Saccharothrix variisporea TaxID=543527 RepID=A0A495XKB8_9PSEU|nr:polysaccharide lyase family 7 protein [Saccharothrix variisporea]RKT75011.1 glycosyl hydrolase family 16 [Saccharothrix variisporea]
MRRQYAAATAVLVAAATLSGYHAVASAAGSPLAIAEVTALTHDGNVPANTIDNDLTTRWSAEGDGVWIRYDLGSPQTVGSVSIAWHKGDTRRATFDVELSDDSTTWTTALARKVTSGTTLQPETYDFADRSARYVRIVGHGNTSNDWNSITETKVLGADGDGGGGGTCAYPANVLDLKNWYIGLPTGQNEAPTNVYQPALATYSADPWFVATPDCAAVQFRAAVNGVTTSGSSYPRSELREMNGTAKASWSSTSGTHTMVIDQAITALPADKPHVVAGQIHDASDDVSVFRLEGSSLYITNGDTSHHKLVTSNYVPGTRFQAKFVVGGGQIKAYYNGVLQTTITKSFSGGYFKAGAYTQANCTNSAPCSDTNYGEVKVYGLTVTHDQAATDETQAAVRYGWGTPQPISDEFDYTGPVDPTKWAVPSGTTGGTAGCWPGHAENGRRCAKNSTVANGIMTMLGEANGDTGWLRQKLDTQYGRWEIRSRSRNAGTSGGLYHPLHLIWPTAGNRLENGEYDWVEYSDPDAQCLTAFLHYPKSPTDKKERRDLCPVDMTQWHNFAFEWTAQGLAGYVDGVEWFRLAGGASTDRGDIQAMPSGHLNIQLDNFTGAGGLRPAVFEVDWVRFYR